MRRQLLVRCVALASVLPFFFKSSGGHCCRTRPRPSGLSESSADLAVANDLPLSARRRQIVRRSPAGRPIPNVT